MTLHIYLEQGNRTEFACALEFADIQTLEPTFSQFQRQTGVRLSEYDDAELPPNHADLLAKISAKALSTHRMSPNIAAFVALLNRASSENVFLKFVGE